VIAFQTQPDPAPAAPVAPQETYSGGTLLVLAYAAIWLIVFGFVFFAWQRTRSLEDKLSTIEGGLRRSREAHEKSRAATETTRRSGDP
jgi:CcmD family protein